MTTARALMGEFETLSGILYEETGILLSHEKEGMMRARLRSRLAAKGIASLHDYAALVRADRLELERFVNAMTTNKTEFFREASHFDYLARQLLPAWSAKRRFLVWSAASSTGQEAHTLAMVLDNHRRLHPGFDYRVLGSDIDTDVVDVAKGGIYSAADLEPVGPGTRATHFDKMRGEPARDVREGGLEAKRVPGETLYQAKQHLRERMKFRPFNLTADDGSFASLKFDVVFLRNVLIYFDEESTRKVIDTVVRHMRPGALLFIGHSESLRETRKDVTFVGDAIYRRS